MFVLERLIGVIAPHYCLACGGEGDLVCNNCASAVAIPLPSRCYVCKATTDDFVVCDRCRVKSHLRHVWISAQYSGLAKQLVQVYKFERGQEGAKFISKSMANVLPLINQRAILVPIPTATSRQRVRGYDHTKLLAKEVSELTGLPYESMLGRLGQSRQVGTNRRDRLTQLSSAFYIKHPERVRGESIILVDDIVTTGGTLESIAKILKQAGAKSVNAIIFAQKNG